MADSRAAIAAGRFLAFKTEFLEGYQRKGKKNKRVG